MRNITGSTITENRTEDILGEKFAMKSYAVCTSINRRIAAFMSSTYLSIALHSLTIIIEVGGKKKVPLEITRSSMPAVLFALPH